MSIVLHKKPIPYDQYKEAAVGDVIKLVRPTDTKFEGQDWCKDIVNVGSTAVVTDVGESFIMIEGSGLFLVRNRFDLVHKKKK